MNKIGVMINYKNKEELLEKIRDARSLGIECCQICFWDTKMYTDENAAAIREIMKAESFEISALWAGWSGPCEWNFSYGPSTIGLVPTAYRAMRLNELFAASDFAEKLGVRDMITHVGFLPNDPSDEKYVGTVAALRRLARLMKSRNQRFLFETGQETPVTLLRTIEDIGSDNIGINLDTANLILYGMANTLDALDVFGKYVMNTHIKDGLYPTEGKHLGKEVKAGDGKADLPRTLAKLAELGYEGPYTIEREISGEEQRRDIMATVAYLREIAPKNA